MKVRFLFPALISLALPTASALAQSTQVGTVLVKQNNSGNNAASVTYSMTAGSSDLVKAGAGSRGDIDMEFGNLEDPVEGAMIASVAELSRDNTAFGDAATVGRFVATAGSDNTGDHAVTKYERYFMSVNASPSGSEVNINAAVGFFPFRRWLAGHAQNSTGANSGVTDKLYSHSSIRLGKEFTSLGSGVFTLNLKGLEAQFTSQNGILLVNHGKNEANYATSKAVADGTFRMYVRDNAADGAGNEQDPISFVYLHPQMLGTDGLVTLGRVKGNGSTAVLAGPAEVTKGTTGRWYIKIPGHSPETGSLLISPEGGDLNNFDNIACYEWDAANSRYIVESRDIQGAAFPSLQNGGATEDMFSFAFFHKLLAPEVTLHTPAAEETAVAPASIQMTASASDRDGVIAQVQFLINGIVVATDVEAPYEFSVNGLNDGIYRCEARAFDNNWCAVSSKQGIVIVSPAPNPPVTNPGVWFDGVNDYITLGNPTELKLGTAANPGFTLECWFRKQGRHMQAAPNLQRMIPLITKGREQGEDADTPATTNDINYAFGITEDGFLTALFEGYPDAANGIKGLETFAAVATHTPIADGEWHHGAMTYHAPTGTFAFYLDGVPAGTSQTKVGNTVKLNVLPRYDNAAPVGIGTSFNTSSASEGAFPGVLDEVRIWNFARSASSIQGAFNASINEAAGLVARYGFDEGKGAQTSNSVGTRARVNLVGEPAWVHGAPLTNQAPRVSIAYPVAGERFAPSATVQLTAAVADAEGPVAKVEFFDGTTKLGEVTQAPYTFGWTGGSTGSHNVTAVATDSSGLSSTSDAVSVQIGDVALLITEVHSASSASAPAGAADFWELTNTSASAVLVAGYTWDDSRKNYNTAKAWALPAGTTLNAGESVIFTKADPAVFRTWWGLSAGVRVFRSTGSPDLDANDSITVYTNTGVVVTSLSYGVGGFTRPDGSLSVGGQAGESAGGAATASLVWDASYGALHPRYTFSGTGVNGGVTAAPGGDIGSPGGIGNPVQEPANVLSLAIAPKIFLESAPAVTATLVRFGDASASLEVSLISSDVTEVSVPATVTFAPGESAITFPVTPVNDFLVDGLQNVRVTATAVGAVSTRQDLVVLDDGDVPAPDLRLTEVQSSQAPGTPAGAADYWEVTNFSVKTVQLEGFTWDDSRKDLAAAQAWKFPAGTVLAPGESAVVTLADPAAFRAWWGLTDQVKVWQTVGAPTLEENDSITLYTSNGIEVFSFNYAASGFTRTLNLPATGGHAGPSAGATNDFTALVYDPASTPTALRYQSANIYRLGGKSAAQGGEVKDVGSPGVITGPPLTAPSPEIVSRGPLQFTHVSTVAMTGSEISAYDSASKRLFVTCSAGLQILALNDPVFPVKLGTLDFTQAPFNLNSTDVTSVASRNGVVAVAVPNLNKDQAGSVVFFTAS
ncbi:MAG TPA: Ig-like domain-containing protein, partial [Prosthecobacter sp.]